MCKTSGLLKFSFIAIHRSEGTLNLQVTINQDMRGVDLHDRVVIHITDTHPVTAHIDKEISISITPPVKQDLGVLLHFEVRFRLNVKRFLKDSFGVHIAGLIHDSQLAVNFDRGKHLNFLVLKRCELGCRESGSIINCFSDQKSRRVDIVLSTSDSKHAFSCRDIFHANFLTFLETGTENQLGFVIVRGKNSLFTGRQETRNQVVSAHNGVAVHLTGAAVDIVYRIIDFMTPETGGRG